MEMRNNCAGPRSMMDESILRQILADMAEAEPGCGCGARNHNHNKSCGKPACDAEKSCGCSKAGKAPEKNPKPCGCDAASHSTVKPCGCGGQARQEMAGGGESHNEPCIAGGGIPTLAGLPLVMAYVPNQDWEGVMEPEEALEVGTLFSGLNFPWYPSKCRKNGRCGK